jgi:signal transduction histidine kinase
MAENIGLILVKLEAREYLLDVAGEAEDRLRELNELKNRHLGIAAHDLRNPIGAIRGMSGMLARGRVPDGKKQKFLESIVRVSEQMLTLVEDLLDVSVIESGKFELDLSRGNLAVLAQERSELAAGLAQKKSIKLVVEMDSVPDTSFDPPRVSQVIDNLLSNALKFSPPESTVHLSCFQQDEEIAVAVQDEGPGIPPDELVKIFGTYQKTTVRPTGGEKSTGLGLYIVKKIIDAHRGSISVKSTVGEGTTFTVAIPIQ